MPLQPRPGLAGPLGPLELRVLEQLWATAAPATVRELADAFPAIAYTTLMTTADRLFRKGLLERVRDGRAFRYRPRWTREELGVRVASSAMASWLSDPGAIKPIISLFVDEVSRRDQSMLDELERLVREKKEREG